MEPGLLSRPRTTVHTVTGPAHPAPDHSGPTLLPALRKLIIIFSCRMNFLCSQVFMDLLPSCKPPAPGHQRVEPSHCRNLRPLPHLRHGHCLLWASFWPTTLGVVMCHCFHLHGFSALQCTQHALVSTACPIIHGSAAT
jgi:hypothetical protein